MIKGLYTAAASMLATSRNLDVVTNNLANTDTDGFKRKEGVYSSFPEVMIARLQSAKPDRELGTTGTGVFLEESYTDFRPGNYRYTGQPLDFAIEGNGFFQIEVPDAEATTIDELEPAVATELSEQPDMATTVMYTKNGDFTINQAGQLVTQQGYRVLGANGQPLVVTEAEEIQITGSGDIVSGLQGGEALGVVSF